MLLSIGAIIIAIFLAGFYGGSETGGYMVSEIHLHFDMEHNRKRAFLLNKSLQNSQRFVFTILVCQNIAIHLVSMVTTKLYLGTVFKDQAPNLFPWLPWNAEIAACLTLLLPLFLFADVIPKNIFRKNAYQLLTQAAYIIRWSVLILRPITWPLECLFRAIVRKTPDDIRQQTLNLSPERLRMFFSEGLELGDLSNHQNRLMENVIAMRTTPLTRAMIPLRKIPAVSENASLEKAAKRIAASQQNRCVVFRGRRNYIVGTLHFFDILREGLAKDTPIKPVMDSVVRLPDDGSLQLAFSKLRKGQQPLGVVMNRKERAIGLVKIENIAHFIARAEDL